jgi:hypothetical protein
MTVDLVLVLCSPEKSSNCHCEISFEKDANLLKRFRLLNQMMLEIPMFWVRLPDGLLKSFVNSIFIFLWTSETYPTPFTLLSIIDFEGKWFAKWFLSCYARNVIVPCLEKDGTLKNLTRNFVRTLDIQLNIPQETRLNSFGKDIIEENFMSSLECFHLFSIIGRLLCFAQGRSIFPIKAIIDKTQIKSPLLRSFFKNESLISFSIDEMLELMLKLMVDNSACLPDASNEKEKLNLKRAICDILRDISSSTTCTRQILYKVN